jgi:uncharacterized protein (TIGR00251 family)
VVDDLFDVLGDDGVVLRLHVQPGAGRTAVVGRHGDALKVRVAAPPEGGRANEAVTALVATTFGVDGKQVELTSGASSRSKRVKISGVDVEEVRRLLSETVGSISTGNSGNNRAGRDVRPPAR